MALREGDIVQFEKDYTSYFDVDGNLALDHLHHSGDIAVFLRYGGKWFKNSICVNCGSTKGKRHFLHVMTHQFGPCLIAECVLKTVSNVT